MRTYYLQTVLNRATLGIRILPPASHKCVTPVPRDGDVRRHSAPTVSPTGSRLLDPTGCVL